MNISITVCDMCGKSIDFNSGQCDFSVNASMPMWLANQEYHDLEKTGHQMAADADFDGESPLRALKKLDLCYPCLRDLYGELRDIIDEKMHKTTVSLTTA